jgi:hypothetical protein
MFILLLVCIPLEISGGYTSNQPSTEKLSTAIDTNKVNEISIDVQLADEIPSDTDIAPLSSRGILKWKYPTTEGTYISTPALVDLDGDDDLEIVFISEGNAIYALSNTGDVIWKNEDYTISRADEFMTSGSFYRPGFFSSVTPADISGDDSFELLFSADNKIVTLDSSGSVIWTAGDSNRDYISTPAVADLAGNITNIKTDQEIVVLRDNTHTELQPQIFDSAGNIITTLPRPYNWNDLGYSSVTLSDLDGSNSPDTWKDIIFSSHGPAMKLYSYTGTEYQRISQATGTWGTVVYGTGAVGDFVGDAEEEFFVGTYEGALASLNNPAACTGYYYLYDPINDSATQDSHYILWRFALPTTGSGIIGSPAVGDVHGGISNPTTGKIGFEGFLGSYNGVLYSIDLNSGNRLWEFDTGASIFSSPALCDIDSDTQLEVIVASNNGIIYCLDGDPSDGTDEGISDSGGTNYDILWQYDTGGNGTYYSSPVVADIDNDNTLEVVIGDRDGNLWVLNAGPSNITGQIDWPMFQYDAQNTGVLPTRSKSFNITFQLLDGDGDNNETCYAQLKPYTFRVQVDDGMGFTDLKHVILTFDPLGNNVQAKWTRATREFTVINDPENAIEILSTTVNSTTDLGRVWTLDFQVIFNWSFDSDRKIACSVQAVGHINPTRSIYFDEFVKVENDLEFKGNLVAMAEFQGKLQSGSWVRGGENITWSNLIVVYSDSDNIYPETNKYKVTLSDDAENQWEFIPSSTGEVLNLLTKMPEVTAPDTLFSLNISKLPVTAPSPGIQYSLKIDNTPPDPPDDVVIHADSFMDSNIVADNDTQLFATWTSAAQEYSGIKGYYYTFTNKGGTTEGTFTTENSAEIIADKPGLFEFYIWAEDMVGNLGMATYAEIYIDLEELKFSSYTPQTNDWFTTRVVNAGVTISDGNGIGVDSASIQYSIKPPNSEDFGPWLVINQDTDITQVADNVVTISSAITFPHAGINFIRWQARDRAGNGYTVSDPNQLLIDHQPPRFEGYSVESTTIEDLRKVKFNITILDDGSSGINATSIEYKFSTDGIENYTSWKNVNQNIDSPKMMIEVFLELNYGSNNFIAWRVKDVAGNGYVETGDIQITINTPPIIDIRLPINNSKFFITEIIEFDGSGSYDPDDDVLSYYWEHSYSNQFGLKVTEKLSSSQTFKGSLAGGANDVMLFVDDGYYNITKTVYLFVYDQFTDLDQDGMPDYWEEQYPGLDPNNRADANLDLDGDGKTNLEEFQAETNPADPTDYPGKKTTDDKESSNNYLFINILVLVFVIVFLAILFVVKRSRIKKARFKELQASKPAVLLKRDIVSTTRSELRAGPQVIPSIGPQKTTAQQPQLSPVGAPSTPAQQQRPMPQLPPHVPTVDTTVSSPKPSVAAYGVQQTQPSTPTHQPTVQPTPEPTTQPTISDEPQTPQETSEPDKLEYKLPTPDEPDIPTLEPVSETEQKSLKLGTLPPEDDSNSNSGGD